MNGKVLLSYFSGTGNTYKVVETCGKMLEDNGYDPVIHPINSGNELTDNGYEFYGFYFPVYALGLPRIVRKYLSELKSLPVKKKAFLIVTGGDKDNNGWSLKEGIEILERKNIETVYSDLIQMPNNWAYEKMNPENEVVVMLDNAVKKTKDIMARFLAGETYHKPLNLQKFGKPLSKIIFYLFHKHGVKKIWKLFRVDRACTGCGLCASKCPAGAIIMKDGRTSWNRLCEICTRCINFCPINAVGYWG